MGSTAALLREVGSILTIFWHKAPMEISAGGRKDLGRVKIWAAGMLLAFAALLWWVLYSVISAYS
jgi:hypothetical protein